MIAVYSICSVRVSLAQMNTNLVRVLESPAINTVVRGVDVAFWEPCNVAILKTTRSYGLERAIPVEGLPSHLQWLLVPAMFREA